MGYSIGAKIIYDKLESGPGGFCIIHDTNDKKWGYSISTRSTPEIELDKKQIIAGDVEIAKFWVYYSLIINKIEIPVNTELTFILTD